MQILSNSMKTPSSLKKKMVPPSSVPPWNTAHPKAADAAASFFDPGCEVFKKKSCGHNFPRSDLTRTRGWCLNHLGQLGNWMWMGRWGWNFYLPKKKNCIFIKMKDLTTWKCDAFLSAKKQMVLLSWSSGLLHICSHHWSNCIIWILAFVSRLPKGKAIGVHVGEVHSVKLHLEISKGEPNQTKKPPAHNSNHTRHFPDLSSRKKNFWVSESGKTIAVKFFKTLPFGSKNTQFFHQLPPLHPHRHRVLHFRLLVDIDHLTTSLEPWAQQRLLFGMGDLFIKYQ